MLKLEKVTQFLVPATGCRTPPSAAQERGDCKAAISAERGDAQRAIEESVGHVYTLVVADHAGFRNSFSNHDGPGTASHVTPQGRQFKTNRRRPVLCLCQLG